MRVEQPGYKTSTGAALIAVAMIAAMPAWSHAQELVPAPSSATDNPPATPTTPAAPAPPAVDPAEKKLLGAEGLLARGQYDLASQEFSEFLKLYPNDKRLSRARFGRALAAYGLNDAQTTITTLEAVVKDKAFPRREEALALLGTATLAQGQSDRALATFDTLLKDFPHGNQAEAATLNRAQALHNLGRFADSQTALNDFLKAHPTSPLKASALYVLSLNQRALGEEGAAVQTLKQITTDFPNAPFFYEAQLQLGEALAAQGKIDEALAHYRKLEADAPDSRKPAVLFGLGMALSQAGRFNEAQQAFERVANTYRASPFAGAARLQSAVVYVRAGDRDKGRTALAAVAQEFPAQATAAAYWQARCDLLDGKYQAAKDALTRLAAAKTAELPEIQFDLAYCDLMLGSDDTALRKLEVFRTAYPYSPHVPEAYYYEGTALHRLGDFERSLQFCDGVIGDGSSVTRNATVRQAMLLKAENLLMLGQYDKSDAVLATLEKAEPPSAGSEQLRIAFRRGQAAYFSGDFKTAEERLAEVVKNPAFEKDPTLREALFFLGDSQLQRGESAAAVETLKTYRVGAAIARADEAAYKLAVAQVAANDPTYATATLQDLMDRESHSVWVQRGYLKYAELCLQQNNPAKAKESLTHILGKDTDESVAAPANYVMATQIEMADHPQQAADRLAALLKNYPKSPLAEEATYVRGVALKQAQKPEEAQKQFNAYIAAYPGGRYAADARHQAAVCMTAMGKSSDAIKTLTDMAARRETRNDGVLYDLAWAYRTAGDNNRAIETYHTVLSEYPQSTRARAARVELPELLFADKHYQEAVDLLTAALADKSTEANLRAVALYRLGHCYARLNDPAKAAANFDAFAKFAPTDPLAPDAISEAGAQYALLNDLDQAKNHQLRVLSEFSMSAAAPVALLRLGEVQNQAGDYETAGVTFTKWLKQNPNNPLIPSAQFGLGWSLENRKKLPEAREAYEKVIATDNGSTAARAQFQIGETYFAEGKFDAAAKELLKVDILYAAPEWAARALYEAGRAFEQLKDPERAKQQYRDCLKKYKDSDVAPMAKKRLESLGGA